MAGIRGKNTKPEMTVRRALHAKGFRFRVHCRNISGTPDLCLSRWKAVIFVHGCFWHGHDCHLYKVPSTREGFWVAKIKRNREVDARNQALLLSTGWRVGIVWECALKGKTRPALETVIDRCEKWIRGSETTVEIRGHVS